VASQGSSLAGLWPESHGGERVSLTDSIGHVGARHEQSGTMVPVVVPSRMR
jgi:hypothetical protein